LIPCSSVGRASGC